VHQQVIHIIIYPVKIISYSCITKSAKSSRTRDWPNTGWGVRITAGFVVNDILVAVANPYLDMATQLSQHYASFVLVAAAILLDVLVCNHKETSMEVGR
jgi:hypothetical protein